jgi:hypothetical protein
MANNSGKTNWLSLILFGWIAIWAVPLWEWGKKLLEKALDGFAGWLLGVFVGLPASIVGGIIAGSRAGGWIQNWIQHNLWNSDSWVVHFASGGLGVIVGALAFWVCFAYGWSAVYMVGVRPVNTVARWVRKFFDAVARDYYKSGQDAFIGAVKTVFQPSSLWSAVQEKDKNGGTWVTGLLGALAYVSLFLCSLYLAFLTLTHGHGLIAGTFGTTLAVNVAGWAVGALAAWFVLSTVLPILADFMDYARLSFEAVVCGLATAGALLQFTPDIVHGSPSIGAYAGIFAIETLAVIAYVFPAVYLLLTGGLMKKIAEAVRKLFDTVLDEQRTNFRRLFHEGVTIALVWRFSTLSLLLWALLGIPAGWSMALAIAVGALTYVLAGELFEVGEKWSVGNSLIGFVAAAHAGGFTGYEWASHGFLYGTWGGIVVGVFVFLLSFCFAYPIFYKVARAICDTIGLSYVGIPLSWAHEKAWKGFRWVMRKFEKVYERGYWDDRNKQVEGDFRKAFLHVVNALVSLPAGAIAGAFLWKFFGLVSVLTIPAGVVGALLAYLLVGQVILKGGTYLVGTAAAIVGGIWVGSLAYNAVHFTEVAQKVYVALPVGILGWFVVFLFVFPALYIVLRLGLGWSTEFVLPLVAGIYDTCWQVFDKLVWQPFLVVFRAVRDYFWLPIWKGFKAVCSFVWNICKSIWNGIMEAWNGIFGRNRA